MLWSCLVFVGLSVASLCSRELLGLLVGGASAGDVSVFAGVVLTIINDASGLITSVLLQSLQDLFRYWGRSGDVSTLGLETTLTGSVADGVDLAIITGVLEATLSLDTVSLTALFLSLDSVLSFVVVSEGIFLHVGVQSDDSGILLEGSLGAVGLFRVG